jgi:hypothetical protein
MKTLSKLGALTVHHTSVSWWFYNAFLRKNDNDDLVNLVIYSVECALPYPEYERNELYLILSISGMIFILC